MTSVTCKRCPSPVNLNLVFPLDQPPLVAAQRRREAAIFGGDAFGRFGGHARLVLQIILHDLSIPSSSMFN